MLETVCNASCSTPGTVGKKKAGWTQPLLPEAMPSPGPNVSRPGRGAVTHTQQQLHALPEEYLLHFLPHTGQELFVSQGHLGVNESDLETK
jgi:hypothetical protein